MDETKDEITTVEENTQDKETDEKLLERRKYLKERQTRFRKRQKLKDAADFCLMSN